MLLQGQKLQAGGQLRWEGLKSETRKSLGQTQRGLGGSVLTWGLCYLSHGGSGQETG